MVKETEYYETLEISPTATQDEIKRAYRRMAVKTHPDKNPDDPTAQVRFQAVSEAYQVLSDPKLRKKYDEFGKQEATPDNGFEDPMVMTMSVFGGGAFESYIGELSLLKELSELMKSEKEDGTESEVKPEESENANSHEKPTTQASSHNASTSVKSSSSSSRSTSSNKERKPVHAIGHSSVPSDIPSPSHEKEARANAAASRKEKEIEKEKKRADQRKRDEENRIIREQRIEDLTHALIGKLSVYTELEKTQANVTEFIDRLKVEADNLKMESFGIQILHTIGNIYYTKASLFLKSQKLYGLGGMFGRVKEAGTKIRDMYDTFSTAMEAGSYINTASQMEPNVSAEKQAELDMLILGKVLGALWVGSRFEIQNILRQVCDRVLSDKSVTADKRRERAEGLKIIGNIFRKTERTKEESEEMQFFESVVADASAKKAKMLKKDFGPVRPAQDTSHHIHLHARTKSSSNNTQSPVQPAQQQ